MLPPIGPYQISQFLNGRFVYSGKPIFDPALDAWVFRKFKQRFAHATLAVHRLVLRLMQEWGIRYYVVYFQDIDTTYTVGREVIERLMETLPAWMPECPVPEGEWETRAGDPYAVPGADRAYGPKVLLVEEDGVLAFGPMGN